MNLLDQIKMVREVQGLASEGYVDLLYGGGPGSGRHPYGRKDKDTGKTLKDIDKEKQKRALASYKPSTRAMLAQATDNEKKLAKAIGGEHIGDHQPFDVLIKPRRIGLEVKTLLDNKRDAITMHQGALERKMKAIKDMKLKAVFTIVFDNRPGRDKKVYVTKGLGSFRLFAHRSGTLNPRFSVHNDVDTVGDEL